MSVSGRALLFLDVDGPLIPFRARPDGQARGGDDTGNPLLVRLNPADGPRLLALGCELVWATSWLAEANEVISPRIGLPELAVVDWPDDGAGGSDGVHWKTRGLVAWAAGRPFVWLDDEIGDADRVFVAASHPGRALLHRVDPLLGLTERDLRSVAGWLAS